MPTLKIDDIEVTVEPGTTVIEAAKKVGVDVPHFCYHPKLSISGNCRMCLVEVEKMPKPQISCSLIATDGMVVKTQSENAQKWRKNVLEFILVNHPLDCPVCDQAGECKLQDYYLANSVKGSQFQEEKVHKPKKFELGPHVMLDDERCIMCSRCVRFCDEITHTSELGLVQRGDHVELRPFPGKKLDNPYSINTVDICPVGALTNEDFRFKKRVWFLESASSVCTGCARGCNIKLQSSAGTVYRYLPRENNEVNQVWLCDAGRMTYKEINAPNRLLHVEKKSGEQFGLISPVQAIKEISEQFKALGASNFVAIGNAQISNENNYALKKFATTFSEKSSLFYSGRENDPSFEDDLLRKADRNPNSFGVTHLQFSPLGAKDRLNPKVLLILGELSEADLRRVFFNKPQLTIVFSSHKSATTQKADYVFPITTFAEEIGSFTNFEGRVQKFTQGLKPRGEMLPVWVWLKEISSSLGNVWNLLTPEGFLKEGFGLTYSELGETGKKI